MSQDEKAGESALSVLAVAVPTVLFIGFAFISLKWTIVAASVVLLGMLAFLWSVGIRKRRARRRERDAGA